MRHCQAPKCNANLHASPTQTHIDSGDKSPPIHLRNNRIKKIIHNVQDRISCCIQSFLPGGPRNERKKNLHFGLQSPFLFPPSRLSPTQPLPGGKRPIIGLQVLCEAPCVVSLPSKIFSESPQGGTTSQCRKLSPLRHSSMASGTDFLLLWRKILWKTCLFLFFAL